MSSFTPFPRLPTELRLQIWQLSLPSTTYLHLDLCNSLTPRASPTRHILRRHSSFSTPFQLHATRESRLVASKHFCLLGRGSSRAYFNSLTDVLIISPWLDHGFAPDLEYLLGDNAGLIRRMAYSQRWDMGWGMDPSFLRGFEGLQSFVFIDLTEWEDLEGGLGWDLWDEMRRILGSVRAEDLVVVETVEGERGNPWTESAKFCRGDEKFSCQSKVRGRELEVGVMRIPVPKEELEKRDRRVEMKRLKAAREKRGWWGASLGLMARIGVVENEWDWYHGEKNRGS